MQTGQGGMWTSEWLIPRTACLFKLSDQILPDFYEYFTDSGLQESTSEQMRRLIWVFTYCLHILCGLFTRIKLTEIQKCSPKCMFLLTPNDTMIPWDLRLVVYNKLLVFRDCRALLGETQNYNNLSLSCCSECAQYSSHESIISIAGYN